MGTGASSQYGGRNLVKEQSLGSVVPGSQRPTSLGPRRRAGRKRENGSSASVSPTSPPPLINALLPSTVSAKANAESVVATVRKGSTLWMEHRDMLGVSSPLCGDLPFVPGAAISNVRPLSFIEEYMSSRVMPCAAGNKREVLDSATRIVLQAVQGDRRVDIPLFLPPQGSGWDAGDRTRGVGLAIDEYCSMLRNNLDRAGTKAPIIVFVCELASERQFGFRHSPAWDRNGVEVVKVSADYNSLPSLSDLEKKLSKTSIKNRKALKVGCFFTSSPLTGRVLPIDEICELLHKHRALAFFDMSFSTAAVSASVTAKELRPATYKDCVFIPSSRMPGGCDASDVLIMKCGDMRLLRDTNKEALCLGAMRAALAIQLSSNVGEEQARLLEKELLTKLVRGWGATARVDRTGYSIFDVERVCDESDGAEHTHCMATFNILSPVGNFKYLHPRFVKAVLCDLFGIHVDVVNTRPPRRVHHTTKNTGRRRSPAPPASMYFACVQVSLGYDVLPEVAEYIGSAIGLVAKHGYQLLKNYAMDYESGVFHHCSTPPKSRATPLTGISYLAGDLGMGLSPRRVAFSNGWSDLLDEAERVMLAAENEAMIPLPPDGMLPLHLEKYRWFPLSYDSKHQTTFPRLENKNSPRRSDAGSIRPVEISAMGSGSVGEGSTDRIGSNVRRSLGGAGLARGHEDNNMSLDDVAAGNDCFDEDDQEEGSDIEEPLRSPRELRRLQKLREEAAAAEKEEIHRAKKAVDQKKAKGFLRELNFNGEKTSRMAAPLPSSNSSPRAQTHRPENTQGAAEGGDVFSFNDRSYKPMPRKTSANLDSGDEKENDGPNGNSAVPPLLLPAAPGGPAAVQARYSTRAIKVAIGDTPLSKESLKGEAQPKSMNAYVSEISKISSRSNHGIEDDPSAGKRMDGSIDDDEEDDEEEEEEEGDGAGFYTMDDSPVMAGLPAHMTGGAGPMEASLVGSPPAVTLVG